MSSSTSSTTSSSFVWIAQIYYEENNKIKDELLQAANQATTANNEMPNWKDHQGSEQKLKTFHKKNAKQRLLACIGVMAEKLRDPDEDDDYEGDAALEELRNQAADNNDPKIHPFTYRPWSLDVYMKAQKLSNDFAVARGNSQTVEKTTLIETAQKLVEIFKKVQNSVKINRMPQDNQLKEFNDAWTNFITQFTESKNISSLLIDVKSM